MTAKHISVILLSLLTFAGEAAASIVGGSTNFSNVSGAEPAKVGNNNINVTKTFFGFDEQHGITLGTLAGYLDSVAPDLALTGNERVASHYVYFDPAYPYVITGQVSFDSSILGIIWKSNSLLATNSALGLSSVAYQHISTTGLEREDLISFSGNTLNVRLDAFMPGDHMRVITAVPGLPPDVAAIPEPSDYALMLAGLSAVALTVRRRKAA